MKEQDIKDLQHLKIIKKNVNPKEAVEKFYAYQRKCYDYSIAKGINESDSNH